MSELSTVSTIQVEQDNNGLARVTLNRPAVHNAFDETMIAQLRDTLDRLNDDENCRAVVLSGAGKSFSAGADLEWMKRAAQFSHEQNLIDAEKLAALLNGLYNLRPLTVACVAGAAMGGGMGLVACCDIVIADRKARFALPEIKLGLTPATIAPYVLNAIGPRQARRYFQTGETLTAEQAQAIGLIHMLVDGPQDMKDQLATLTTHIQRAGPHAMKQAKRLVLDYGGQPLTADIMADSAERIAAIRARPEAKEGLAAFLEKRKPDWNKNNRRKKDTTPDV